MTPFPPFARAGVLLCGIAGASFQPPLSRLGGPWGGGASGGNEGVAFAPRCGGGGKTLGC